MITTHWTEYFQQMYEREDKTPLIPRAIPCEDCAVQCFLYDDISDELKIQAEPLRENASRTWFCHNDRSKFCRGNWNNVYGDREP